jgi:predicted nucleic acid-binding protein
MAFVIDASAMLGVLYGELPQDRIDALMLRFAREATSVPAIFPFEVFNSLDVGRRRGRITAATADLYGGYLAALKLDVRPAPTFEEAAALRMLAERHHLTVYDASYLALSLEGGIDLITLDRALERAARDAGVPVSQP